MTVQFWAIDVYCAVLSYRYVRVRLHGVIKSQKNFLAGSQSLPYLAQKCYNKIRYCFLFISPPSVVMSQYTFKGFPLFSRSIQYSPPPLESPESRMSLQEWAGLWEYQPFALIENKKRYQFLARDGDKTSLHFGMCWKLRLLQVSSTVSYRFLFRMFLQSKLFYTNIDIFVSFRHSHKIRYWGIQSWDIPERKREVPQL